jgi:hypothetical protein
LNLFKNLFGFEIVRRDEPSESVQTFVQPSVVDDIGNAQVIGVNGYMGNHYSNAQATSIEVTENNHIQQCREVSMYHEIDSAIEEIVSEAIITDENQDSIKLDLSQTSFSDPIREKVRQSFKKVYNILDFKTKGYNIFRKWYIDGRLYYHIVIDEKSPKTGIKELRNIDPKKIRRIRQFVPDGNHTTSFSGKILEYYVYNSSGIDDHLQSNEQGTKISKDSIAYAHSGLTDANNKYIVSFLNKAIAPTNKLRTLENSMVIYRLVRAPERRIFYIDVGNLPKGRAEQYLQTIAQKYKTKLTYDSVSGKIKDDRQIMSMTEDYFIPRRDGNKSTEVVPLQGASQNGGVDELEYFKKELLRTLNVPYSRLDSNSSFNIGNSGEMSKEEANFAKFIARLRTQFNMIFDDLLGKELVLTQVMSIEEWESEKKNIHYDYLKDNYFAELLQSDMLATRLGTLAQAEPYVGKYFSMEFVKRHILMQTDEEIENEAKQIEKEFADDPDHHVPVDSLHQTNLHKQMTDIDMDKEIAVNATIDPNPFKEELAVDNSTIKLNESMTALFKSMTHENLKMIDIDDITV